jgi:L-threonylcarbamoyladenylate synthase
VIVQTVRLPALAGEEPSIGEATRLLRAGEVVAFPTETVYGLGADAFNAAAVGRVFEAKGRPADNPLIVHVATPEDLERCAAINDRARLLMTQLMPGPLTLVLPARSAIPSIVRAGLPTVAVRMPDHPVALALIRVAGPLVAPSANTSGRPSPTTAQHVLDDLDGRIAAVLDGGPCHFGLESTVLDVTGEVPAILREGSLPAESIAAVLGEPVVSRTSAVGAPRAPGMKYRHYAPRVPVTLVVGAEARGWRAPEDRLQRLVLVAASSIDEVTRRLAGSSAHVEALDARTLYAAMRRAEDAGLAEIVVLMPRPDDASPALLDRLRRAARPGGE